VAKQKVKEVKEKDGFNIISKSPQKELEKLGIQLSKQNRENKGVSGSKEQITEEVKEETQQENKGEESQEIPQESQGGFIMDKEVEERFSKLEKVINQVAGHIGTLAEKEKEEEHKKAEAEAQAKIDKIISTRVEEKTKSLKDSVMESLKKANEETKKMIEELKKAQVPPEPKKEEEKKIDFDSQEYQDIIVKNVKDRAKPETRKKIAEELTAEERLCLDKGVCPVNIVKQLAEKGFVIKKKEEEEEKEEIKKSLI